MLSDVDGLAQLAFLVTGLLERRAADHGLSLVQIRLLGILRDRTPTMQQLASLLELDKSSVSGLVSRAEQRGLVARVPSTTDRRVVLVELSEAGRALVARGADDFATDVTGLLRLLPAGDRARLAGLVERLVTGYADREGIDLSAGAQPGGMKR
jgi:MarR family transcriptional regulator, lower aerobic nicotinate degradation pathway regulator